MELDIKNYNLGVQVLTPKINYDDRGFVTEIFRNDWNGNEVQLYCNTFFSK